MPKKLPRAKKPAGTRPVAIRRRAKADAAQATPSKKAINHLLNVLNEEIDVVRRIMDCSKDVMVRDKLIRVIAAFDAVNGSNR